MVGLSAQRASQGASSHAEHPSTVTSLPRPAVPPRLASHLRLMSGLATAPRTPTASEPTTPASEADWLRQQLPSQVEAQQRRSRCVPLPCLCPSLWLALASSLAALRYAYSLGLLLSGVRLLTGRHAREGCGREGEREVVASRALTARRRWKQRPRIRPQHTARRLLKKNEVGAVDLSFLAMPV